MLTTASKIRRDEPVSRNAADDPVSRDAESDFHSPWIALERYIRELEAGRQSSDRYTTALATICDSTAARLAFIQADGVGPTLEMVGDFKPARGWCRDLAQALAARFPRGGLWKRDARSPELDLPAGPLPRSAVILPVDQRRSLFMVAVNFDPDQPLDDADFRVIKVIWRLQIHNNRNARLYENLKETLFGIVRCLSTAIDAKDPCTRGHSERVARIAVRLGEEMALSRGEINDLYLAGLLHDVGKIGIRDDVLLKPGPLTPEELEHVKEHPVTGDRIISNVTRLAYLRPAVRGHHERYDGKGYPDRLKGEAIPLAARILGVADACDAMMSARRYRLPFAPAQIEAIFAHGADKQWDPAIVKCFFACRHELYSVSERGLGQSVYLAVERAAGCANGARSSPSAVNTALA